MYWLFKPYINEPQDMIKLVVWKASLHFFFLVNDKKEIQ